MNKFKYKCSCGKTKVVRIRSNSMKCDCGNSKSMQRVLEHPNVQFRGKGFYSTGE